MMKSADTIIVKPIISEKSMDGVANKCYTFEVQDGATKADIAHAVEEMFGVKVDKVNTVSMKKKPKRLGVHAGYTSEWKKAIVTLKSDSKTIEFFDGLN